MSKVASEPFGLSDEQREIQALCREFAQREIRPISQAVDEADTEMPWDVWYKAAAVGITSFMLPEEYGGGGIHRRVHPVPGPGGAAAGAAPVSATSHAPDGFFAEPVLALGSDEQKRRWLEPLTGETPMLPRWRQPSPARARTPPRSRPPPRSRRRLRPPRPEGWISNGGVAEFYVVFATVDPARARSGVTAFVVEQGRRGSELRRADAKMGQRAIVNAEMFLDDVFVPERPSASATRARAFTG